MKGLDMRKFSAVALLITAVVVPVVNIAAPRVAAATVPSGFTDVPIATLGASTGIVGMPDGSVLVLEQSGSVRLIRNERERDLLLDRAARAGAMPTSAGCSVSPSILTSVPTGISTCTSPTPRRACRAGA